MAIAIVPNPALKRIVEALGLDRCTSLSLSAQFGSVVTVTAEQYATETQLDALATELETRDYVLVPKDEYERLRLTDAERAAVKAADASDYLEREADRPQVEIAGNWMPWPPPRTSRVLAVREVAGQRYVDVMVYVHEPESGLPLYPSHVGCTHWMPMPALPHGRPRQTMPTPR